MADEHRVYTEEEVKDIKRALIDEIIDKLNFTHKTVEEIKEEMLNEI